MTKDAVSQKRLGTSGVTQRYFIQFNFVIMIVLRCYNGCLIGYYIGVNGNFFFTFCVIFTNKNASFAHPYDC